eukprot:5827074-Pyramimonas_sp.AAC.1
MNLPNQSIRRHLIDLLEHEALGGNSGDVHPPQVKLVLAGVTVQDSSTATGCRPTEGLHL